MSSTIVSSLAELAPSAAAPVSAALLDSYVYTLVRALAAAPPVKVAESILDKTNVQDVKPQNFPQPAQYQGPGCAACGR